MTQRIANVYFSLNEEGKFRFPEQEQLNVDPNKLAVAVSGGGTKSMTATTGFFRALMRKDPEFYKHISYISGVSGGSWFATIFTLAKMNLQNFLGESILIHDINRHTLNTTNYYDKDYIGNVISNFPVTDTLLKGYEYGIKLSKIWEFVNSSLILDHYLLDDLYLSTSKEEAKLNMKFNNIKCTYPKKDYPFLIVNSATLEEGRIVDETDVQSYEFTPMYQGMRVPNTKYGGILFSNSVFGCDFKELNTVKDGLECLTVKKEENCTLEIGIASSSAAFGVEALKLASSHNPIINKFSNIRLTTKVWGFTSKESHIVNLMDGYFMDYTGVISLAARGCKKIISFINCSSFDNNYCNIGIAHLFGLEDEFKCIYCELRDKVRIFSLEDWIQMRLDFEARLKNGKIGYFHRKMNVLHNWNIGVNGGYETEILFIPLLHYQPFFDQLKIDIRSNDFPELNGMPNIGYMPNFNDFINGDKTMELNNAQVNFLSTYCDWYLTKVMKEIPEFFN